MKKCYARVIRYASEDHKRRLVDTIDATQKGNESRIQGDISQHRVSLEKVQKNAAQIWGNL